MRLRGRFNELFRKIDVLVTPTVAVTAFAAGTIGVDDIDGRKVDCTSAGRRLPGRSTSPVCRQRQCPAASIATDCQSAFRSSRPGFQKALFFDVALRV